jgi:hypothetical protein
MSEIDIFIYFGSICVKVVEMNHAIQIALDKVQRGG